MRSRRWLWLALAAWIAGNLYFAATLPATSAEGAVYTRYTSKPLLDTWSAPFDLRIGVLYALAGRIGKWVGGVSELTLRLPALFGGLLWGLSFIRIVPGWRTALLMFAFLLSDPLRVFSTASGTGLALGLTAFALQKLETNMWLSGLLLGLAVASAPTWIFLAAVLAAAAVTVRRHKGWTVLDEFLLPALLSALLFLSPLVLARGVIVPPRADDRETRDMIRKIPVGKALSVRVSEAIEPGAAFYKRRLHLNWKGLAAAAPAGVMFDYYLLLPEDRSLLRQQGLRVLASAGMEILAAK